METFSNKTNFIILSIIFFTVKVAAQTIDYSKITTETELNFVQTEKRGIQSNEEWIFMVDSDDQTLIGFDTNKSVRWKVNVIEKCGKPAVGVAKIRYMNLNAGHIEIILGKHDFASIELSKGKVKCLGAD